MILDGHIHTRKRIRNTDDLFSAFSRAGVDGGVVISLPPEDFRAGYIKKPSMKRLDHVLTLCEEREELYPFFWVDPLEHNAAGQVREAAARGIAGIKIICDRFAPGHEQAMQVYAAAAREELPVLFHSGILWDGAPSSSNSRPAEFEPLLEVEGLRFSLAHISWPWCDECIAVYGKFLNSYTRRENLTVEMFIDTTPGTPPVYRKEVLEKLFATGYDVQNNVIFGSDSYTDAYNADWFSEWHARDTEIIRGMGMGQETVDRMFGRNLKRFLGIDSDQTVEKAPPKQAE